jgi:hypothetical protein
MTLLARMKLALTGLAIAAGLCAPTHARQTAILTNTARLSYVTSTGSEGVNSNTTTLTATAAKTPDDPTAAHGRRRRRPGQGRQRHPMPRRRRRLCRAGCFRRHGIRPVLGQVARGDFIPRR